MITLHYTFLGQLGATYTVKAFTAADPLTEVASVSYPEAVADGAIAGDFMVASYEPHLIQIFACDRLVSMFTVTPVTGSVPEDLSVPVTQPVVGTVNLTSNLEGGYALVKLVATGELYYIDADYKTVPYGVYEIMYYGFNVVCTARTYTPALHTNFTLSDATPSVAITINCTV